MNYAATYIVILSVHVVLQEITSRSHGIQGHCNCNAIISTYIGKMCTDKNLTMCNQFMIMSDKHVYGLFLPIQSCFIMVTTVTIKYVKFGMVMIKI